MNKNAKAFTITEFLVAQALSLIVITAALTLYLKFKNHAAYLNAMIELENNYLIVKNFFNQELNNANFYGCNKLSNLIITNNLTEKKRLKELKITKKVKVDTDILFIKKLNKILTLEQNMMNRASALVVSDAISYRKEQVLVVADCVSLDYFIVTKIRKTNLHEQIIAHRIGDNSSSNLSKSYSQGAFVGSYNFEAFYVADTNRVNSYNDKIYGLYLQDIASPAVELVADILAFNYKKIKSDKYLLSFTLRSSDKIQNNKKFDYITKNYQIAIDLNN